MVKSALCTMIPALSTIACASVKSASAAARSASQISNAHKIRFFLMVSAFIWTLQSTFIWWIWIWTTNKNSCHGLMSNYSNDQLMRCSFICKMHETKFETEFKALDANDNFSYLLQYILPFSFIGETISFIDEIDHKRTFYRRHSTEEQLSCERGQISWGKRWLYITHYHFFHIRQCLTNLHASQLIQRLMG